MRVGVKGLGFKVQGLRFRVQGVGITVTDTAGNTTKICLLAGWQVRARGEKEAGGHPPNV